MLIYLISFENHFNNGISNKGFIKFKKDNIEIT